MAVETRPTPTPPRVRIFVAIPMQISEPYVSLMHRSEVVATTETSAVDFTLRLELTGRTTEFSLSKIDAKGSLETLSGSVELEDYDTITGGEVPKPWFVTPALGLSFTHYTETSVSDLSFLGIHFKVAGGYRFRGTPERWEAIGGGSFTLLPLVRSDSTRTTRFLSLSARAVFHSPWLRGPWTLDLAGGYQYTTMVVSPADHGFGFMNSLFFAPTVSHAFSKGVGRAYVKLAPILGVALGNREIGFGLAYDLPRADRRTVCIELEVSQIGLTALDADGAPRTTSTWNIGLTGGYRF